MTPSRHATRNRREPVGEIRRSLLLSGYLATLHFLVQQSIAKNFLKLCITILSCSVLCGTTLLFSLLQELDSIMLNL